MFTSVPIGSLMTLSGETWKPYVKKILSLPATLQTLLFSPRTGAFIRGLAKNYDLPVNAAPTIAFSVVQISLGERQLAQLASMISTDLKVAHDKAQKIAQEIEKELFAPVMLELNQYLSQQKNTRHPMSSPSSHDASGGLNIGQGTGNSTPPAAGGARNILDLKAQPRPPLPPPIPPR